MLRQPSLLFGFLLLYIGSYVGLSFMGEYGVAASGKLDTPLFSLSIPDSRQWQPKGLRLLMIKNQDGEWDSTGNSAGYFYAPLILMDRKFWHPTKKIFK